MKQNPAGIASIPRNFLFCVRFLAIGLLVAVTNFGFLDRVELLVEQDRLITLVAFLGVWVVSLAALVIAAMQPNNLARIVWALCISASSAAAYLYYTISGSDLAVFDVLSLWLAKHESARALAQYQSNVIWGALLFLASFIALALPPVPKRLGVRRWLNRLFWAPAVPVFLIAAILSMKAGGGSQALPKQFAPLAVSLVTASKVATQPIVAREAVAAPPAGKSAVRNIVLLVDESVRADYLNFVPGNPFTPRIAALADRIIDFGPATSGGNCSHYSNAILRLGASRRNLSESIRRNPTLWQYAKKAGFRTVYIDAQAGVNTNPGVLQNFMTVAETRYIDRFVRIENSDTPDLDFRLLEVMQQELASKTPVFIYANKNGAHFPYDRGYREKDTEFTPTINQAGRETVETRINSYRNVIKWSVDGFFARMFAGTDLQQTAVLYTSDHGQAFWDDKLSHCSTREADPREGLVPVFAITEGPELAARFANAARLNRGKTSHFALTPTILQLMGYDQAKVTTKFGASLFEEIAGTPAFTSGDVFGLFNSDIHWTPVDLSADYRQQELAFTGPGKTHTTARLGKPAPTVD